MMHFSLLAVLAAIPPWSSVQTFEAPEGNCREIILKPEARVCLKLGHVSVPKNVRDRPGVWLEVAGGYTDGAPKRGKPYRPDSRIIVGGKLIQHYGYKLESAKQRGVIAYIPSVQSQPFIFDAQGPGGMNDLAAFSVQRSWLMQSHLVVFKGKRTDEVDNAIRAPRRAYVRLRDDSYAFVQCNRMITFREFADFLIDIAVVEAVNLDMGGWDKGWYRHVNEQVVMLGERDMGQTHYLSVQDSLCD